MRHCQHFRHMPAPASAEQQHKLSAMAALRYFAAMLAPLLSHHEHGAGAMKMMERRCHAYCQLAEGCRRQPLHAAITPLRDYALLPASASYILSVERMKLAGCR